MLKLKLVPGPPKWYLADLAIIKGAIAALEGVVVDDTIAMMLWQRYSDSQGVNWVDVAQLHSFTDRLSDAEIVAALANYYEVTDDE